MSIFDIDIPEGIPDETYATDRENSSRSEGSNASIYKEYGGFNKFLLTHGLRNYNQDDVEEGKAIATEMRRADEQNAREAEQQRRRPTPQQHSQLQGPGSQQNRSLNTAEPSTQAVGFVSMAKKRPV
ncbi:hypothetical protein M758_4G260600 [Ceratodon purpureus]|nr:hypothetical protein M758_4G260600 [Ceratodon purpureus]